MFMAFPLSDVSETAPLWRTARQPMGVYTINRVGSARLPMASALPSKRGSSARPSRQLADALGVRACNISGSPLAQKGVVRARRRLLHQLHAGDCFEILVVDLLAVGLGDIERVEDLQGDPRIHG